MEYTKINQIKNGITYLKLGVLFSFFVFFFGNFVIALSVGNPSAINGVPGETIESGVTLMNLGTDSKDVIVEVIIEEGVDYINFPDGTNYEVLSGTSLPVRAIIKIPTSANYGDSYPVKIVFKPVKGGTVTSEGTVSLAFGYRTSFDINVRQKESLGEEPVAPVEPTTDRAASGTWIWIIAIVIVLIIIIWWLVKRKKE